MLLGSRPRTTGHHRTEFEKAILGPASGPIGVGSTDVTAFLTSEGPELSQSDPAGPTDLGVSASVIQLMRCGQLASKIDARPGIPLLRAKNIDF